MATMRRGEFERLLRDAFDPAVSLHGFEVTPQPPDDFVEVDTVAAVYEARPVSFVQRFPSLVARWAEPPPDAGCVDLWVEADDAGRSPRGRSGALP